MKKFGLIIFSLVSLFMFTGSVSALTCNYNGSSKAGDTVNVTLEVNEKGVITKFDGNYAVNGSQWNKIKSEVASSQTCPKYSFIGNNGLLYIYTEETAMADAFDGYGKFVLFGDVTKKSGSANKEGSKTGSGDGKEVANKKTVSTDGCGGVFGSTDDPQYFAYYLFHAFQIIKFLGPILVIIMSILDLVKITADPKQDDQLQKLGYKTVKRLIYAGLIFVLPDIIDYLFKLIGLYGTCGIY